MELQERYTWHAEKADGTIVKVGGDLTGCVSFTLVPQAGVPRHEFRNCSLVRRFCRGFVRGMGGGVKDYYHCVETKTFRAWIRYSDGHMKITELDYELKV